MLLFSPSKSQTKKINFLSIQALTVLFLLLLFQNQFQNVDAQILCQFCRENHPYHADCLFKLADPTRWPNGPIDSNLKLNGGQGFTVVPGHFRNEDNWRRGCCKFAINWIFCLAQQHCGSPGKIEGDDLALQKQFQEACWGYSTNWRYSSFWIQKKKIEKKNLLPKPKFKLGSATATESSASGSSTT